MCGETINHCVVLTGYKDYYEAPWGTYEVWNLRNNWGKVRNFAISKRQIVFLTPSFYLFFFLLFRSLRIGEKMVIALLREVMMFAE